MHYIDGFLLPLDKESIEAYRAISSNAGNIWIEHGALEYRECVLEDAECHMMRPFTAAADARTGETVVFAYIVYRSREHRDEVNAKVMADPRIHCEPEDMPFDCKRMAYGGFRSIVELGGTKAS